MPSTPQPSSAINWNRWLPALVAVHMTIWILMPTLLEGSIRLDVSEGAIGGREWQLAYLRHPPFTTWLVEIARWTGPFRYAAVYAIGQALAVAGLTLTARLAWRMEKAGPHRTQVFAATMLMGLASPVLTYIPIQVSHNIGLMLATGLVSLAAWQAFERARVISWLFFGLAVGLSLWVKYAIGLLLLPIVLAFLLVPRWRQQIMTPGPWLAVLVAALVILPHILFVVTHGATTIAFAARTVSTSFATNLVYALEFLLNAALFMLPMAVAAAIFSGDARLMAGRIATSFSRGMTRADLFRHMIAFGPVLVTGLAALTMGVKPRLLWLTPMVLPFALWWAHFAAPFGTGGRRGHLAVAALSAQLIGSYGVVRLVSPYVNAKPLYPDFDGPALAALARGHWSTNEKAPLKFIVSFGQQRGRQAAGSVAFDLPSPPNAPIHVMEDASLVASPWIDVLDLKKEGALVVSPVPLEANATILGAPVGHIVELPRPMVRGATKPAARIWLGIAEPVK